MHGCHCEYQPSKHTLLLLLLHNERANGESTYGVVYEWFYNLVAALTHLKGRTISSFAIDNFASYKMYWFLIGLLLLLKALIEKLKLDGKTWEIVSVFYCLFGMPLQIKNSLKEEICYILLIAIPLTFPKTS